MSFLLLANYGAIVNGVALTFIALFMVYGYVKGFAKSFVSVFGTILSLLFAVVLCTACANFLQEQYNLVGKISEKLATPMFNLFGEETMSLTLSEITDGSFKGVGVSKLIVSVVLSFAEKGSFPPTTTLLDVMCPTFAYYAVIIIAVVVLFTLFKIIFFLIGELIKKMYAFKPIQTADKTLGGALGIVSGIVYLEFIIMVISLLPIAFFQRIYAYIGLSPVASFIEKINLFSIIIKAISISDVMEIIERAFHVVAMI